MDKRPIGMFDSGVGGMTVFSKLIKELPNEDVIYFGDLLYLFLNFSKLPPNYFVNFFILISLNVLNIFSDILYNLYVSGLNGK